VELLAALILTAVLVACGVWLVRRARPDLPPDHDAQSLRSSRTRPARRLWWPPG